MLALVALKCARGAPSAAQDRTEVTGGNSRMSARNDANASGAQSRVFGTPREYSLCNSIPSLVPVSMNTSRRSGANPSPVAPAREPVWGPCRASATACPDTERAMSRHPWVPAWGSPRRRGVPRAGTTEGFDIKKPFSRCVHPVNRRPSRRCGSGSRRSRCF